MNHAGGKEDKMSSCCGRKQLQAARKTITSSKIIITAHLSEPL